VDSEIVYALLGIIILVVVILLTLMSGSKQQVQTKSEKRDQIISTYEKELEESLNPIKNDKEKYINKKSELLKKFSNELARNIFFENNEIKDIILHLSKKY